MKEKNKMYKIKYLLPIIFISICSCRTIKETSKTTVKDKTTKDSSRTIIQKDSIINFKKKFIETYINPDSSFNIITIEDTTGELSTTIEKINGKLKIKTISKPNSIVMHKIETKEVIKINNIDSISIKEEKVTEIKDSHYGTIFLIKTYLILLFILLGIYWLIKKLNWL